MERTKFLLVILLIVSVIAFAYLSVRPPTIADESAPGLLPQSEAKAAPDFTLPQAASGQAFHLQEQVKTHPVVLDFWATWCGPCRAELPHIETLSRRYAGRVAFLGINSSDTSPNILTFLRQEQLTLPTLSDAHHQVAAQYGADAIPLLLVIDTHGRVRSVTEGYDEQIETNLPKVLDALLIEK